MLRKFAIAWRAAIAAMAPTSAPPRTLKLAIPMRGNWETAAPDLGERAGLFKQHGITFESVYTQGAGETLQVVISGSADIGLGVGTSAALSAFAKGAPIRVIGNSTTGTNDLYWYVRTESPIKSFKDTNENTTIGYSTNGSSSHNFALAILRLHASKAKPTATGAMPATLTQVMTGQIDIGFAVPPMGLQQLEDGKIRIIARASEVPGSQDQTVRTTIVHAGKLAKDRTSSRDSSRLCRHRRLDVFVRPESRRIPTRTSPRYPRRFPQKVSDDFYLRTCSTRTAFRVSTRRWPKPLPASSLRRR